MSSQESIPEPDEFGMIPPKPQEEQEASDSSLMPFEGKGDIFRTEFPIIVPKGGRFIDRYSLGDELTMNALNQVKREELRNLINELGHFGLARPTLAVEKSKRETVEKPDPYPSRAGWRADYLQPHDPLAEEPKDKPKGKIGEYEIVESATTFEDVGGNVRAKDVLIEIAAQFENPEHYAKWDVPVPKGVLLYGPPGTGKTMIAKAFANRANAAFVEVPVATLRDKFYGESEKNLKKLFDDAAKYEKQVVFFFDEIDSLLPDRSGLVSNAPDSQLVNTFLQAMDGIRSATNVMVLGATNYPHRLDAAAIRPGRFDQKVEVKLPDREGCREIAAKQLLGAERKAQRVLVEDSLDLEGISHYLEDLSGADIAEVLNRVKRTMAQTERAMRTQNLPEGIEFGDEERNALRITTDDIVATAINYRLRG